MRADVIWRCSIVDDVCWLSFANHFARRRRLVATTKVASRADDGARRSCGITSFSDPRDNTQKSARRSAILPSRGWVVLMRIGGKGEGSLASMQVVSSARQKTRGFPLRSIQTVADNIDVRRGLDGGMISLAPKRDLPL